MPVVRVESALDALVSAVGSIRARTATRPWVQPFGAMVGPTGSGGASTLHVHGRVLSGAPPELDPHTLPERLQATWRRWETDELPGAVVHASVCGVEGDTRADDEGYFRLAMPLGADAS